MLLGDLYNSTMFQSMSKQLDTSSVRQKVIAHNLANVDTPHYKRSEVRFEDAFREALEKPPAKIRGWSPDSKHIPINPKMPISYVQPEIWRENDTFTRSDNNNVDIDVEMAELAKNELMYDAVMERMSRMFSGLRHVITSK